MTSPKSSVAFLVAFSMVVAAAVAAAAHQATKPPQTTPPATAAQTPGAPGAKTPPPAVPASRKFTSDAGVIFNVIKPDKTADFDAVMAKVKEGLGKSSDPIRKQEAVSWRVFKGLEAGPGGNVIYMFWFDPPVKDADYTVTDILREAFPNEAQDLWGKFIGCFVDGQTMLNLQMTTNMSSTAAVAK